MKYLVAQLGARMHYAVPRILHSVGCLDRLYLDFCLSERWFTCAKAISQYCGSQTLARVLGRCPDGIPHSRIGCFNNFGYRYLRRQRAAKTHGDTLAAYLWGGTEFCRKVLEQGLGEATGVYAYNSAALELLLAARREHRMAVLEQTIAPMAIETELLKQEHLIFPEWTTETNDVGPVTTYEHREMEEWGAADIIICGSNFVREGIIRSGGTAEKCVVVPYGIDLRGSDPSEPPRNARRNGPLRVLTVGTVCLRKGSPYILEAARQMKGTAQFRMVGSLRISFRAQTALREYVDLVGPVASSEVQRHFEWADIFFLPSLCEGSATAVYEALAHGLPVVCTLNTGSVVRDQIDGFIVPIRDTCATLVAIDRLAKDRGLLERMSKSARERAKEYTIRMYASRLLSALGIDINRN